MALGAIALAFDAFRCAAVDNSHDAAPAVIFGDDDGERISGRAEDRADFGDGLDLIEPR